MPHRQEYSIQITFREEWVDDRLSYDDMNGRIKFLVLTDPDKIWKPDLFFSNEKDGHFHDIIMPNVLLRIFPDGSVLYSIRISLTLFCPMDLKVRSFLPHSASLHQHVPHHTVLPLGHANLHHQDGIM